MFLLHDNYGVIFHYKSDVENIETMLCVENGTLAIYRNDQVPSTFFRNDDVMNLQTHGCGLQWELVNMDIPMPKLGINMPLVAWAHDKQ